MKFFQPMTCDCGGKFPFQTYGAKDWPSVVCDKCGKAGGQIDPLSVSVIAERLLYRSLHELEAGEYTLISRARAEQSVVDISKRRRLSSMVMMSS